MKMATPDYSLIWAANSPLSPYTFSDANYLTGWNFIGPIPPDRRMFDAWMNRCDEKEKWLYDNTAKQSDLDDLKQYVQANGGVPAGTIISYAGQTDPDGWLLCDGSPVSRTTYPDLFAAIGTLYGAGDGSTTFNLPDLTDRFLQGSATPATVKAAGLPAIKGSLSYIIGLGQEPTKSGSLTSSYINNAAINMTSENYNRLNVNFNAARSSQIYGASDTVQPPAVTVRFLIKASGASGSQGTATNTDVQNMLDGVFS